MRHDKKKEAARASRPSSPPGSPTPSSSQPSSSSQGTAPVSEPSTSQGPSTGRGTTSERAPPSPDTTISGPPSSGYSEDSFADPWRTTFSSSYGLPSAWPECPFCDVTCPGKASLQWHFQCDHPDEEWPDLSDSDLSLTTGQPHSSKSASSKSGKQSVTKSAKKRSRSEPRKTVAKKEPRKSVAMKEPRKFPVGPDAGTGEDSDDSDDEEAFSGSASVDVGPVVSDDEEDADVSRDEGEDADDVPHGEGEVADGEAGTTDEPVAKRKRRERYRPWNVSHFTKDNF